MFSTVDSEASKKDGAPIPPATDRAQADAAPALLSEGALLRLEEALRAVRALGKAEKRTADWLVVSTQTGAINETPPLAPSADQHKIRAEEPVPSRSWRRRKLGRDRGHRLKPVTMDGPAGLLQCALLLVVGAAALGVSLKARTAGSTDTEAAPVNIEARGQTASRAPDNDEPPQPITNAVKSSAAAIAAAAISDTTQ
jgi:hypothetical protein